MSVKLLSFFILFQICFSIVNTCTCLHETDTLESFCIEHNVLKLEIKNETKVDEWNYRYDVNVLKVLKGDESFIDRKELNTGSGYSYCSLQLFPYKTMVLAVDSKMRADFCSYREYFWAGDNKDEYKFSQQNCTGHNLRD
ncbi:hypothetical protein B4U80_13737 [Leptotrombidium deliense]|uniref:NTR domain-containing protein n=1 Tax=Leptotrombidium deliense TaxID=299467 RepID=A0A443SHB0_9ACAR|nr:hypothetical protein B4U80_13737 [Leptotrombidium deliense]